MILGLGSGLFFSHMPFIKLHGMAVTSFRPLPGQIFSRVMRGLGVKVKKRRFLNSNKSMQALDRLVAQQMPVGVLVGVYHLSYFPKEYRFHFNAHNIAVIGKEDNIYHVSDPVLYQKVTIGYDELKRVRYAKGTYPPYGKMYWISDSKSISDKYLKRQLIKAIRFTAFNMVEIPRFVPFFGVNGIRYLAKNMRRWEKKFGERKAILNLAQVVRMLEEIGTGGAGFRFMYAAFLHEAAAILACPELLDFEKRMTAIGNLWREFATEAGRKFKNRGENICSYDCLADKLMTIADAEEKLFKELRETVKQ